jgi:benzoyl-CoA reductase/2-hydroxyglutaryl-CoA dehydratase subunit BcrC/BadD/HgdB
MEHRSEQPRQLSLEQWDQRYGELQSRGECEAFGGSLRQYEEGGDFRLTELRFDNSAAAFALWDFLLSETTRLYAARRAGKTIVGAMKDLGTVPVMAYALPKTVAFYPDGTWWVPCVMRLSTRDLAIADSLGIDETFCPVRAMLGAFTTHQHFPEPDLLICSVGATCDDFSAIAQRLEGMGRRIFWWEIPARRGPAPGEQNIVLPGGLEAAASQVAFVAGELKRVAGALEKATGETFTEERLVDAIAQANEIRALLRELRHLTFTAELCPLPALELLIAEMLAIHYCSDRQRTREVLEGLLAEVRQRVAERTGFFDGHAAKIFWVNPVADLRVMNLLEECGGRLCGTDFMFGHALEPIPTDVPPMEALAQMALADPMVGPSSDRARRVMEEARHFGAEAVVISRIPGASHCALEGAAMRAMMERSQCLLPVVEIEVPPVSDALRPALRTRLEALVEIVRSRRQV